ncbi:membrane alanyl aminopeptidase-like [Papilio machaon]|uniref:membrane alanyl aminopeptidase-like n=1 Tax=Papilio machaon TaxID=76193 RepID=UPI001E665866|nr:membrane alanyl aminopeptidase-like [Papilio machaon]
MGARWLLLLLGTVLVQGTLSLSPLPVPEDEWEEFYRVLRDPAYRLPTTTRPRHYEVSLTPYFDIVPINTRPFSFDGEVTIYISPTVTNVNEIVMHCNDLTINSVSVLRNNVEIATPGQSPTCEMPFSFLRIRTNTPLQLGQEYVVKITFNGNIQTNMRGFYRSFYHDNSGRRWMGTTQFQPGHARQAFPCYDEPSFKATFDITIVRETSFSPTISNMPIRTTGQPINGRIAETFWTTPLTSTYLLAFIVSHYVVVASNNNTARPFDIYARNNAGTTGDWSLEIGELLLDAMERYTQIPYYTMAPNINMKQAAIPDFSAGAMENWGLLTYREALILFDPIRSNNFYRQRVANIVSHEVVHMWFGNLVTCAWWDNLWLNEGFARFYQYYLTQSVAPELGYDIRFIVEQLQTVMISDSIDTAHALTDPDVNSPSRVSAHFSSITYARGASIIRMTQHLLGNDTFVKGLRYYLSARKFDVAEPHHLFENLDAAAAEDNALSAYNGITIDTYFRSWSEKAGHPLLTVIVDQRTGQMNVSQTRWERNTGVSQNPSLWHIPITWTRGALPDFENLKPSLILSAQTTVIDRGSTGLEWVIFNKQESGFYRVDYDDTNWALLTRHLRNFVERSVIHELNRAQIVDDLFAFGRAGTKSYERVFNILSFLEFESSYGPWIAAINGYNFVLRRLAHDTTRQKFMKDIIIRLSGALTRRLGYTELPAYSYMDNLLRMYSLTFLCNIGHDTCVSEARRNFQNWRYGGAFIPPNMRPWVYCTGLRYGTVDDFQYFWKRYLGENLASEKAVMLEAAGCTNSIVSLWQYLDAIVAMDDAVREQDYNTAMNSAVSGNEANTMWMFEWLQKNVNRTIAAMGSVATPVSYIAGRLLNERQISEFQAWLDDNRNIIGAAYDTGVNGIAAARTNLEWSARRIPEMDIYFRRGYEEDVIEDINDGGEEDVAPPEVSTERPVVTPEGDNDTGSANTAVLSIVTLLTAVVVNIMV